MDKSCLPAYKLVGNGKEWLTAVRHPAERDSSLRASEDVHLKFEWFLSQYSFQADDPTARVKRDVSPHVIIQGLPSERGLKWIGQFG